MILGYHYYPAGPIPIVDFTYGYPDTAAIYSPLDMMATDASVCDSTGLLQFYTNGVIVANKFGQVLDSSTDFNYDLIMPHLGITSYMGYYQCAIIVPYPGHPGQYYLFHVSGRDFNGSASVQPFRLAYSTVDMTAHGGNGLMVKRNMDVLSDTLLYSTLQAVKHGNGRDWWIVVHEYNSNGFYAALLSPDSIITVVHSFAGPVISQGIYYGQSKFSPDGSKYVIANKDSSLLYLFQFDRCTGMFAFDTLVRHTYDPQGFNFAGCSFSPNSRYLYATDLQNLYQYDTYASNLTGSEQVVGTFDGMGDPFPAYFFRMFNAPDNKIYINTWGGAQHLHVINAPDISGTNCNFVQRQQKIINYCSAVPDFPNYRLGALNFSPCDTLLAGVIEAGNRTGIFVVYPNPAMDEVFLTSVNSSQITSIQVLDMLGNVITRYSGSVPKINFGDMQPGAYFIRAGFNNGTQITRKVLRLE